VTSRPQLYTKVFGALEQRWAGQGDIKITNSPDIERCARPEVLAGNGAASHGRVDIREAGGLQAGVKLPAKAREAFRIGET